MLVDETLIKTKGTHAILPFANDPDDFLYNGMHTRGYGITRLKIHDSLDVAGLEREVGHL